MSNLGGYWITGLTGHESVSVTAGRFTASDHVSPVPYSLQEVAVSIDCLWRIDLRELDGVCCQSGWSALATRIKSPTNA